MTRYLNLLGQLAIFPLTAERSYRQQSNPGVASRPVVAFLVLAIIWHTFSQEKIVVMDVRIKGELFLLECATLIQFGGLVAVLMFDLVGVATAMIACFVPILIAETMLEKSRGK